MPKKMFIIAIGLLPIVIIGMFWFGVQEIEHTIHPSWLYVISFCWGFIWALLLYSSGQYYLHKRKNGEQFNRLFLLVFFPSFLVFIFIMGPLFADNYTVTIYVAAQAASFAFAGKMFLLILVRLFERKRKNLINRT